LPNAPSLAACAAAPAVGRKELDFAAYQTRYVALEVLYLGHQYDGFARQDTTQATIEEHLFAALRKTRLAPAAASWQELQYSRGGRTDKGVSGLGQVVALRLRSAGRAGQASVAEEAELDYPMLINRALPDDIRVLGWATAPEGFSARFSARFREYKYFIIADAGLDVGRMRAAAAHLVGEHDFRNFCKPDVAAVRSFRRRVMEVRVERMEGLEWGGRSMLELYIQGTAFLYHQVRRTTCCSAQRAWATEEGTWCVCAAHSHSVGRP
jgi:tRNA pseudouridine38/39 synthase